MTNRKFYKTVITIEILSEEPIPETMETEDILFEAKEGNYSMRPLGNEETELNGKEAALALQEQGSDPGFFNLTPEGDDDDEGEEEETTERCSCGSGLFNEHGECQKCGL